MRCCSPLDLEPAEHRNAVGATERFFTDEAWSRWDDKTYQAGKDTGNDNDWYYVYYDTPYYSYYDNGYYLYSYSYSYYDYDYDYDGYYDALGYYNDWDGDGIYDRYDYYAFTDTSTPNQQKKMKKMKNKAPKSSKEQALSGKILKIKEVQTKGGKHTVVQVQQADKTIVADLGKVKNLDSLNLKEGDQISVKGLMSKVGEQPVLMGRSIDAAGKQMEISRERNKLTGKIVDSRKVKIRGIEHQMAMVDVPNRGKVAVDLGPADKFKMDISKGKELTFSGLPVKVKGKALMMAQSVHRDEKTVQITRPQMKDAQKAGSKQQSDKK